MIVEKDMIYFAPVKKGAKIPTKSEEDGGRDVYACFDEDYIIIEPCSSRLIPTGIATAFSSDYVMVFAERGSTAVKNIKKNAGIIDSGFRGEIFFCLYNGNSKPVVISKDPYAFSHDLFVVYPYSKAICQALMVEVPKLKEETIPYEELLKKDSKRGLGQLGSSDK